MRQHSRVCVCRSGIAAMQECRLEGTVVEVDNAPQRALQRHRALTSRETPVGEAAAAAAAASRKHCAMHREDLQPTFTAAGSYPNLLSPPEEPVPCYGVVDLGLEGEKEAFSADGLGGFWSPQDRSPRGSRVAECTRCHRASSYTECSGGDASGGDRNLEKVDERRYSSMREPSLAFPGPSPTRAACLPALIETGLLWRMVSGVHR